MELSQFDVKYVPRAAIKGQALADFVCEFYYQPEGESELVKDRLLNNTPLKKKSVEEITKWVMYVDGSSKEKGAGAGLMLESPEGDRILLAVNFGFEASNNEAEYEAMIAGIQLAKEMKADSIEIHSDSQLVVFQILGEFQAKKERMATYLAKVKDELADFESFTIKQILRDQNSTADALAKMGSAMNLRADGSIPVKFQPKSNIHDSSEKISTIEQADSWMGPIIAYLKDGTIPEDRNGARTLRAKSTRYLLINEQLYKQGFSTPLLKCVASNDADYIL